MLPTRLLLLACLCSLCPRSAAAGDPTGGRWLDLTHAFSAEHVGHSQHFPTERKSDCGTLAGTRLAGHR